MLSPYTTPSALNVDTNTLGINAQELTKNATGAMEQHITHHTAGAQDKQTPTTANTTADLPADTDSPTTGAPVAHADHFSLQEGTGEAPHLGLIRSVISLPLYIQDQKID